ncbi:hypothetical protein PUN28_016083 [Cardiocondyla obscurior]|uniref:Proteasome inhibitor PI31 subunit n=1 Tax=Cardiocondyla obscurior TaxID=286306 RepID=A0AAW2EWR5_9HYME
MACANNVFGFELFQKLYYNDIRKKEDVIILFVHWYLTKSGFRCIGIGDDTSFDASETGTELLPTEWSSRPNYALRYVRDSKLHVLLGIKSDTDLLLNFMRHHDNSVLNIPFPIDETVSALHGSLEVIMPSYQTILRNLQKDFVSAICSKDAEIQTTTLNDERSSEMGRNPNIYYNPSNLNRPRVNRPELDPGRVGVRDLDPFGEGSGMIFDPFDTRRRQIGRSPAGLGVPGILPPYVL